MPQVSGNNPDSGKFSQQTSSGNYSQPIGRHQDFGKKLLMTFVGVLLVYGVFYLGTLIRKNMKEYDYIGKADQMERSITVNGFGKVTGNNDIAVTSIGYSNVGKDVTQAQTENNRVMDQVMADIKKIGVDGKDLQSNYSINPEYNYTEDNGQELIGYRVTNNLNVRVRDLSKVGEILTVAGKYGANQVSGLSFTIDDPENLKAEARAKALADAKMKAMNLASTLGVRLGEVISYYESENGELYPVPFDDRLMAQGGANPVAISGGSKDVSMNVSLVYEILQ
jgi:uncharacterized protein YggE